MTCKRLDITAKPSTSMANAPASVSSRQRSCYTVSMTDAEKTPDLTAEQEHALDAHGGVVQGQSFVLMRTDVVLGFFGYDSKEDLQRELQPAFDQADRSELAEWDVDMFLARMHRSHSNKTE